MKFEHKTLLKQLDFPDKVLLARTDFGIQTYDISSGIIKTEINFSEYEILTYSFSEKGEKLYTFAVKDNNNKFLVWDLATGNLLSSLSIPIDKILSATVFPNEKYIAVGQKIRVVIYDIFDMTKVHTFLSHSQNVINLLASPNSSTLFSADNTFIIKIYDTSK
jgi:hypothetical protein